VCPSLSGCVCGWVPPLFSLTLFFFVTLFPNSRASDVDVQSVSGSGNSPLNLKANSAPMSHATGRPPAPRTPHFFSSCPSLSRDIASRNQAISFGYDPTRTNRAAGSASGRHQIRTPVGGTPVVRNSCTVRPLVSHYQISVRCCGLWPRQIDCSVHLSA
jgi:hypothetical protein